MKHFRQQKHLYCRSSNMDTVGKWRWVREEASLLDGDLLLCFNGVFSIAAVIRQRVSLPRWSFLRIGLSRCV
jgi:hypothetical protein